MYIALLILIAVIFLSVVAFLLTERGKNLREKILFFSAGLDSGFKPGQILLLLKVGEYAELENLQSLFWSLPALDRCIAEIVRRAHQKGTENTEEHQSLMARLYSYRTEVELEQSRKKRGLESTRDIQVGQKVRILLPGVGVFSSKVVKNNSRNLVFDYPSSPKIQATSIDWANRNISVYFWRHEDAGYVFDTVVLPDPLSAGRAILHAAHSFQLVRSQKRKSVRAKCSIYAQLYLVKPGETLNSSLEGDPGMKCLLEDLSEDGAMFVVGGKAMKGMQVKIQFAVHDVVIVMPGVIRAVEYNASTNQSRLHLECTELNQRMKNAILTFVYNVLPEEERERFDAIRLSEEDSLDGKPEASATVGDEAEILPLVSNIDEDALPELPDFAAK